MVSALKPEEFVDELAETVLGCLLLVPDSWDTVSRTLGEVDFPQAKHRLIFKGIRGLAEAGKPYDSVSVFVALQNEPIFKECGGLGYLGKLANSTLAPASLKHYVENLRERTRKSRLGEIAKHVLEVLQFPTSEPTAGMAREFQRQLAPLIEDVSNDIPAWSPDVVSYGAEFNPAEIPLRQWILGTRRSRGEVTVDSGPPGTNKSMLMLTDAVSVVTGRKTLDDNVHVQGEVLLLVGEDARRDVEARLAAILQCYHISPAEIAGRLHVIFLAEAQDSENYTLARMINDVAIINEQMIAYLRDRPAIVAVFIDPIAAWHQLVENSNEAQGVLLKGLRRVAVQGNRHVGYGHHVNKSSMADSEGHVGNMAALRGAGVIIADARWVFTMAVPMPGTCAEFGIPESDRWLYRRLDALKASHGRIGAPPRILKIEEVQIANGERVGVLVEVDVSRAQAQAAEQKADAAQQWRYEFSVALGAMLEELGASSVKATAEWLAGHRPKLFTNDDGAPLSAGTIRNKLLTAIGPGIEVHVGGRDTRIVTRAEVGPKNATLVGFEDTLPPPKGVQ